MIAPADNPPIPSSHPVVPPTSPRDPGLEPQFPQAPQIAYLLAALLIACPAPLPAQLPNLKNLFRFSKSSSSPSSPSSPRAGAAAPASRIRFSGQRQISEAQLATALADISREIATQGVTPARADDAAFYTATFYRKAGFPDVETSYRIEGNRVVILIREGPRTLLRSVHFAGNRSIPAATLHAYMIGGKPEQLQTQPNSFPLNEAELAAGADRVRGLYISEGYLDVAVENPAVVLSPDRTRADVTVRIQEGTRYTFGAITFVGAPGYSHSDLLRAAAALGESTGTAYSATQVTNMTRNLESFFRSRGHYDVTVTAEAQPEGAPGAQVPVTFQIVTGPVYSFDGVRVTNQTKPRPRLRNDFLPKRFRHLSGQRYDPAKLDETYREMLRTGLFSSLRVNPVALPNHQIRLDLTAEEAKAKELGFTIGFGSYEGFAAGLRLADRDFLGNGRPLSFSLDYAQRGLRGELLYVDPWLFESRYRLRARLFSTAREEEGYTKNSIGARLELDRPFTPHFTAGAFLEQENARIRSTGIEPEFLGPTPYALTTFGLTQTTDYRDNELNPRQGWIFTSSFGAGTISGSTAFFRGTGRYSYYQPVGKKCLLALGARVGIIHPQIEQIPIDVRFFNGGATTVRSFRERQLGPKDRSGHPIGGEFFSVLNAELTFPVYRALEGATFIDAGNVAGQGAAGAGDLRYALGVGLRYQLPVGPIRLDYGLNPNPRSGESRGAFHFSFGFAF